MGIPKISEYNRSCCNCKYFDFADREDAFGNPIKGLNRECTYPKAVTTIRGVCRMWKDTRTLMERLKGHKVMKGFC